MHDPLAVGIALNKGLVQTEKYFVDVETRSELCDGQLVCDFQNRLQREANLHISLQVDADAFFQMFIDILNGHFEERE